jgi:UDP-N-acetyl-D-galactosamine dehydrogenase
MSSRSFKAGELGYKPKILLAGREINDGMAEYTVRQIVKILAKKKVDLSSAKIGLFGFSFKDNCPDIRNTKAFQLITELEEWGCQVSVYDPQADPSDVENEYGIRLNELSSMQSLDVAIFTVAHKEFEDWSLKYVKSFFKASGGFLLADLKGIFNTADASDLGFSVYRL